MNKIPEEENQSEDQAISKYDDNQSKQLEIEIIRNIDERTTIRVHAYMKRSSDLPEAVLLVSDAERELFHADTVSKLRRACTLVGEICCSTQSESSMMERMIVTIAANYPKGLTLDEVFQVLGIEKKATSAYVSSGNNWTAKYLHIDSKRIKITSAGIFHLHDRYCKSEDLGSSDTVE